MAPKPHSSPHPLRNSIFFYDGQSAWPNWHVSAVSGTDPTGTFQQYLEPELSLLCSQEADRNWSSFYPVILISRSKALYLWHPWSQWLYMTTAAGVFPGNSTQTLSASKNNIRSKFSVSLVTSKFRACLTDRSLLANPGYEILENVIYTSL